MSVLLELGAGRRASFGKIGHPEHTRYLATTEPDGTVILTPAVVMSASQARLLERPDIAEIIDHLNAEPGAAVADDLLAPTQPA